MAKSTAAVNYEAIGARGAAVDPDVSLMLALKEGDDTAFAKLVSRHQSRVVSLVYRFVGNEAEAEDLAQEVFLRIFRTRHRYQPKARFSTWLYRIAANISLNALRSRSRRKTISMPLTGQRGSDRPAIEFADERREAPGRGMERDELRDQVRQAVDVLPENQKVAVILNKYEDMSYDDIGAVMGCSTMAVKSLLARARSNLRDQLEHYVNTGRVRERL